jgi:hypothetical protein
MPSENVAIAKHTIVFIKEETTPGTLVYPVATDVVHLIEQGSVKQPRIFKPDPQLRSTLSKLSPVKGPYLAGEYNISYLIKPSGSLGVAPRCGVLLKALLGIETIVGGTTVTYTLASIDTALVSFSMAYRQGHIVYWCGGAYANQGTFPVEAGESDAALGQMSLTGPFLNMVWAGTTDVNDPAGYIATDTDITVTNAKVFKVGAKVEFQLADLSWEDNSGAGYLISNINYTTNVITIEALAGPVPDNAEVRGFLPTATDAGTIVHGAYGQTTQNIDTGGAADLDILSSEIVINNNLTVIGDEKVNSDYPTSIVKAGNREIALTINEVVKKGFAENFYYSDNQSTYGMIIPVGDTAAYRYKLQAPQAEFMTPDITGDEELTGSRVGEAFATTAYDDEFSILFD